MKKPISVSVVSGEILKIIANSTELVKKIGIFGSLARGTFNDDSDIDILIEYAATPDFEPERYLMFCKLCNQIIDRLDEQYDRNVDLVHFENDPAITLFDENVGKEVVWL